AHWLSLTRSLSLSQAYAVPRSLHSFPTRRSSDLHGERRIGPHPRRRRRGGRSGRRKSGGRLGGGGTGPDHHLYAGFASPRSTARSEEHTSELQSRENLVCRLLLEKKKQTVNKTIA